MLRPHPAPTPVLKACKPRVPLKHTPRAKRSVKPSIRDPSFGDESSGSNVSEAEMPRTRIYWLKHCSVMYYEKCQPTHKQRE